MITWPVPDDLSLSLSSLGVEIEIGVVPTSVTRQQLPLTVKLTDHTLVSYFTFWVRFPKIAKSQIVEANSNYEAGSSSKNAHFYF